MSIRLTVDDSVFDLAAEVAGNTVGKCINYAVTKRPTLSNELFDETGNLSPELLVGINGEYFFSDQLARPVKDGDHILIMNTSG
jgi:hypothetical protein